MAGSVYAGRSDTAAAKKSDSGSIDFCSDFHGDRSGACPAALYRRPGAASGLAADTAVFSAFLVPSVLNCSDWQRIGGNRIFIAYSASTSDCGRKSEREADTQKMQTSAKKAQRSLPCGRSGSREQRERPLWFFAELVLLIGILAMPCIGVHVVGAKGQKIRIGESRSGDYIFDNDMGGNTGVDEEQLNRLKDIYGVSEVRAWHRLQMSSNEINEDMLIDLSAYRDDEAVALSFALREELLQARAEEIQQQIEWVDPDSDSGKIERKSLEEELQANENALQALQDGYYPLNFYSTSDETALRKILRNLEAGGITEEEFLSGEKAVLLLAPWQQPSDLYGDTYYTVNVKQYQNPENGVCVKCLSPEEPVSVQYGGEEMQIPVGGILYGLDQTDDLRVLMNSPFAVLCSDAHVRTNCQRKKRKLLSVCGDRRFDGCRLYHR